MFRRVRPHVEGRATELIDAERQLIEIGKLVDHSSRRHRESHSLTVGESEIHALLGENGAGKSTLIKLLAAVHERDGGAFEVSGKPLPPGFSPRDVAEAGVRFVHQDFGLIDTMSIMENMALVGGFVRRKGFIDHRASAAWAAQQLERLGLAVDPTILVGNLSIADAQIVAEDLDPVLIYVIVRFLRAIHPASDPAATPVLEGVVRLTSVHPAIVSKFREGEHDPISRWFESEHDYRDFMGRESDLIDVIVDKLET